MSPAILINHSEDDTVHTSAATSSSNVEPFAPLFRPSCAMPSSACSTDDCTDSTVSSLSTTMSSCSSASSGGWNKTPYFVVPESASTNAIVVVEEPHPALYDAQSIEQFYNEAYKLQVPLETVHAACMDAERWAQKWLSCSQDSDELFGWNSLLNNTSSSNTSTSTASHYSSSAIETVFVDPRDSCSNGCGAPVFEWDMEEEEQDYHHHHGQKHFVRQEQSNDYPPAKAARHVDTSTTSTIHRPTPLRVLRPTLPAGFSLQELMTTDANTVLQQYQEETTTSVEEPKSSFRTTVTAQRSSTASSRSICVSPLTIPESIPEEAEEDSDDDEPAAATASTTTVSNNSAVVHVIEVEEENDSSLVHRPLAQRISSNGVTVVPAKAGTKWDIEQAKRNLYKALANNGGEPSGPLFEKSLNVLTKHFDKGCNVTDSESDLQGLWLTLTKPNYFGCLGYLEQGDSSSNKATGASAGGDPLYTLGRMSFDMFAPKHLICSLQGNFNTIQKVCSSQERLALLQQTAQHLPASFQEQLKNGDTNDDSCVLRTYNIIAAFTIEPKSAVVAAANKSNDKEKMKQLEEQLEQQQPPVPIRGIMTTYGYTIPDPSNPNRLSVWITGGRIAPNDTPQDIAAWKEQFSLHQESPQQKKVTNDEDAAKRLACEFLMGVQFDSELNPEDGALEYTFRKPMGGDGIAFVDTLYLDDNLRIVRGHRDTIFVTKRLSSSASM